MRTMLIAFLLTLPIHAASSVEPTVAGRVVDSGGKPVIGAVISSRWNFQGVEASAIPAGPRAVTDASGHFSPLWVGRSVDKLAVMVYDSVRRQGALLALTRADLTKPLIVKLRPLQRVYLDLRGPRSIQQAYAQATLNTQYGVFVAGVFVRSGLLLLPPGNYELLTTIEGTSSRRLSFSVIDSEVRLPVIELHLSPMVQHYGHGTPEVATLLDMDQSPYNIGDLRGRWTLLYFWADWCSPCVNVGVPKLIAFAQEHSGLHDQFRIIAVHERRPGEGGSWMEFRAKTAKFESNVWHGIPPFVIAYDETMAMTREWGIEGIPTTALIDPNGNLVQGGDLSMLAAELAEGRGFD
jgi:thiol-disulfide isomerase/thioredoxin